jgi:hypothetical protein
MSMRAMDTRKSLCSWTIILTSSFANTRIDVTKVPATEKIEYTSHALLRKRCQERPMILMTTFAMKVMVSARKI